MSDSRRPFAVIHGGDEKSAWTEVIEDHTTDYTCATFGELFADFAYQLRNGEHSQLMHRLNACAALYGSVPLPPDEDDDLPPSSVDEGNPDR